MQAILAFLSGHGLVVAVMAFTVVSILLDSLAKIMAALGKQAPSWVSSVANVVASILHFLNGNVSGATNSVSPPSA